MHCTKQARSRDTGRDCREAPQAAQDERDIMNSEADDKKAKLAIHALKAEAVMQKCKHQIHLHELGEKKKERELKEDKYQRWLQTEYACILFFECSSYFQGLGTMEKQTFAGLIKNKMLTEDFYDGNFLSETCDVDRSVLVFV